MIDIKSEVYNARRIAITGHVHPDGDCIGSCLGMYTFLKRTFPEKEIDVFLEDITQEYRFLPNVSAIKHPREAASLPEYDVFICLDCGDSKRIGILEPIFENAGHTVCIDHHVSNNDFADVNMVVADASSTCELVAMVCDDIDKDIATCLYTGIIHDTGVFQYSSTSPDTMRLAARLMESGIDFSYIINHTFYEKTYYQNKILGYALKKAKLWEDEKIISCILRADELKANNVTTADLDGIAEQLRNTLEAEESIFIYERDDGTFKASTRSGGSANLAKVAVSFGGGGHEKAAGFDVKTDPDEAIYDIIKRIIETRE